MKRSADELDAENILQGDKKKCVETNLCTPFCEKECAQRGKHNDLILSLVNLKETTLEQWIESIEEVKGSCDLNRPLPDPVTELRYPLLHWAAMLGKGKAFKWLLNQEFIDFKSNPVDPVRSQSNETVLFSAVRWLHEGVKSRLTHVITKAFTSIFDAVLTHDPDVLLVQEGHNNDTVLHLCARGEEGSNVPFYEYLKGMLGKLQDYSKKNDRLQLTNILQQKNGEGDTFLHLLAKSRKRNREEVKKRITFAIDKFPMQFLEKIKNADEKTADEICNEFRPDPEVFQTNTQETYDSPCLSEAADKEDEGPHDQLKDPVYTGQAITWHGTVDTSKDLERPGRSEDERLQIQSQGVYPEVQSDGGRGDKGNQIPKIEFSQTLPPKSTLSDKASYHSTPSQSLEDGVDSQDLFLTEEPDESQEKDMYGAEMGTSVHLVSSQPDSNPDTQSRAQDSVEELIQETESTLSQDTWKLQHALTVLNEHEEKIKQLNVQKMEMEAAVKRLEEKKQATEIDLNKYKEALSKLA